MLDYDPALWEIATEFMHPFTHWHALDFVRLKAWIWKLKQTVLRLRVCKEEQMAANNQNTTILNDEIKVLWRVFESCNRTMSTSFQMVITNIPDVKIQVQSHDLKAEQTPNRQIKQVVCNKRGKSDSSLAHHFSSFIFTATPSLPLTFSLTTCLDIIRSWAKDMAP